MQQDSRNEELANIFSLQNLKLLGTKEGPELAKLQLQLQKNLEAYFPNPSTPFSTPPPPQPNTVPQSQNAQSTPQPSHNSPTSSTPAQSQNSPEQSLQSNTSQLTLEDKKEIEQLVDTLSPKPLGKGVAIFSHF